MGSDLPEVGLQAAATQLSQFFLTPAATQLLASDPKDYERRVSMLNRISAQVKALQKYRDDSAKALGYHHNPDRIRHETETSIERLTNTYTSTLPNSPKHDATPHRNRLPDATELFHFSDSAPPEEPRTDPLIEFMQLLHPKSPTCKPGAPTGRVANPARE